jgi:hypothetical protein
LAILLFNSVGYRVLTHYLQQEADSRTQAMINAGEFRPSNLVELSVPLDLPYTTSWTGWEHFEGDIEIDGIHYRYVERKLEAGRMYVRCLPNTQKIQVLTARDEFSKLVNSFNKQTESKRSAPVFVSNYLGDYDDAFDQWHLCFPVAIALQSTPANQTQILAGHSSIALPPPEMLG